MSTLVERTETASGYKAGRTLPLRVELARQVKRRRTLVMGDTVRSNHRVR